MRKEEFALSSRNLEQFNNMYGPSKDLLYAKIFLPASQQNDHRSNWGGEDQSLSIDPNSKSFIFSHSLFCYNTETDDFDRSSSVVMQGNSRVENWGVTSDKHGVVRTP